MKTLGKVIMTPFHMIRFDNINRTLGYQVEIGQFVKLFISFFQDWTLGYIVQNIFVEYD